jgi:hypothetical protein
MKAYNKRVNYCEDQEFQNPQDLINAIKGMAKNVKGEEIAAAKKEEVEPEMMNPQDMRPS